MRQKVEIELYGKVLPLPRWLHVVASAITGLGFLAFIYLLFAVISAEPQEVPTTEQFELVGTLVMTLLFFVLVVPRVEK